MADAPGNESPGDAPDQRAGLEAAGQAHRAGRKAEAMAGYEAVLARHPDCLAALQALAALKGEAGEAGRAAALLARAAELAPDDGAIRAKLAAAQRHAGDMAAARTSAEAALTRGDFPSARYTRALAALQQNEPAVALSELDRLLAQQGAMPALLRLRGRALRRLGRLDAAAAALADASRRDPSDPSAPAEQAAVLYQLDRLGDAAEAGEAAVARYEARAPQATRQRALILWEIAKVRRAQSRMLDALDALRRALALAPDLVDIHSYLLFCLHYDVTKTEDSICAEYWAWGDRHAAPIEAAHSAPPAGPVSKKPLTLGIVVGRLQTHPQGWLWLAAYENLDAREVRLIVYDLGTQPDGMTARARAAAAAWRDISGLSDAQAARVIRRDGVDILAHKMTHADGRPLVLAHKPAPVQVQWGGHNTTGMASVDWFLGDPVETPPSCEPHFRERIYRLPDDYCVYTPPVDLAPAVGPLPALTAGVVTFGCFNQPAKLTTVAAELWRRVLAAVPNSVLLLKGKAFGDATAGAALRQWLVAAGLPDDRLYLEGGSSQAGMLARYNAVDIVLDPWPVTGGLTTCEALWMGVPTVTLPGPSFVGRHTAAHLTAAGLGDWVVSNTEDYAEKARAWAQDLDALAALRARLRDQVAASPLCDGPRFARHLTTALYDMWRQAERETQDGAF